MIHAYIKKIMQLGLWYNWGLVVIFPSKIVLFLVFHKFQRVKGIKIWREICVVWVVVCRINWDSLYEVLSCSLSKFILDKLIWKHCQSIFAWWHWKNMWVMNSLCRWEVRALYMLDNTHIMEMTKCGKPMMAHKPQEILNFVG